MKHSLLGITLTVALSAAGAGTFTAPVKAQSYSEYCHERAQRLSGYRGKPGGAIGGAVRGAAGAAIISGILGGDKKNRRDAAKLGAVLGGISNANRPNSRAARIYRLEYQDCIRSR